MPKTSMSMSLESRPRRRSRTQPPTMSARPPASRTAAAMSVARGSESGIEPPSSEPLHEAIADAGRHRVEPDERSRRRVRIHFGNRVVDRARDGVGHLLDALAWAERPLHSRAGFAG